MNPQRTELEFAIREVLRKLGVTMRIPKTAFSNKKKNNKKKGKKLKSQSESEISTVEIEGNNQLDNVSVG